MNIIKCNLMHMAKGFNSCGYNWFIQRNGNIVESRGYKRGAHVENHNHHALGIAIVADYKNPATPEQEKSFWELVNRIENKVGKELPIMGHKHFHGANTECPGTVGEWIKKGADSETHK